jgi:hypothetical protein
MSKQWDFERAVLAFMFVLIVGGTGYILWQQSAAGELKRSLGAAERQLTEIGELAQDVIDLQEEMGDDVIASGRLGPFAYIEKQEVDSRIGKKFNIAPPTPEQHPSEGYEDTRFVLTVALPDYDFTRREIANFLLYIEGNSARMRVTRIRLDLSTRKGAGSDIWKPMLTITDRHPLASG